MQKKAKILFAAIVLSMAALTATVAVKFAAEEDVSALVNCATYGDGVVVKCSGDSGVCVFHLSGADHVCLGSAKAEVPSVPVES